MPAHARSQVGAARKRNVYPIMKKIEIYWWYLRKDSVQDTRPFFRSRNSAGKYDAIKITIAMGGFEMSVQSASHLQPLFLAPKAYCSLYGVYYQRNDVLGPRALEYKAHKFSLRLPEMSALKKFNMPKNLNRTCGPLLSPFMFCVKMRHIQSTHE